MKAEADPFYTIGCIREITGHPVYFVGTGLPQMIEYHEAPPVTAGIVYFLNHSGISVNETCKMSTRVNIEDCPIHPICHRNRDREIP